MPYLSESELEKQLRQQQGEQQQQISGPSGVITSAPAGQPGLSQKGPTKSGSFTNINQYLDANKDQASAMAGKVVGGIQGQGELAKNQVTQLSDSFKSQVDANAVKPNEELINQAKSDTVNFAKDQNNVQQFQKMRDAQYKGPTNLVDNEGFGTAQQNIQKVNDRLKATESESGRFGLVQEQFAKPTYSRGQQRLDQLLLQNDPNSKQQFADVRNNFSGLNDYLDQAASGASQYASEAKIGTEAARKAIQDQFLGEQGVVPQLNNKLTGALNAYEAKRSKGIAAKEDFLDDNLSADSLAALGLSDGMNLYDLNPQKYINVSDPGDINRLASKEDAAKALALAQLLGTDSLVSNPDLAGTQDKAFSFDLDRFLQDTTARGSVASRLNDDYNARLNEFNAYDASLGDRETRELNFMTPHVQQTHAALQRRVAEAQAARDALNPNRRVTRK